jgi:hypothetical protein
MIFTVTVEPSSHPDYDLFASVTIKGRQFAKRGTEAEIQEWFDSMDILARAQGHQLALINK